MQKSTAFVLPPILVLGIVKCVDFANIQFLTDFSGYHLDNQPQVYLTWFRNIRIGVVESRDSGTVLTIKYVAEFVDYGYQLDVLAAIWRTEYFACKFCSSFRRASSRTL